MQISMETLGDLKISERGGHHIYMGASFSRASISWAMGSHGRVENRDLLLTISIDMGMGAHIHWEVDRASLWHTCARYALLWGTMHWVSIHDEMHSWEIKSRRMSTPQVGGILSLNILDTIAMTCDMVTIQTRAKMGQGCDVAETS